MIKSLEKYRKAKLKWVRKTIRYFNIVDIEGNLFEWKYKEKPVLKIKDDADSKTVSYFHALCSLSFEEAALNCLLRYKLKDVKTFKFIFVPNPNKKIGLIEKTEKRRRILEMKEALRQKELENLEDTTNSILFKGK